MSNQLLYDAFYYSGGRLEAFSSFQANKLSQYDYLKWRLEPRKTASCELLVYSCISLRTALHIVQLNYIVDCT